MARRVLAESHARFAERRDECVKHRTPGLSPERAFDCFVDERKPDPRDRWAHEASFDEPMASRLRASGNRRRSSRRRPRSAKLRAGSDGLHRAAVVELPELSGTIFDLGTERPAPTIDAFLTRA